ncbi:hypothetical protein ACFYUD_10865 [Nocardia tengchongensis]|uniref:hypothetical protein n=1 Tax=Nocardia tengchongensis TaxID=2055889 RepID=UPI003696E84F
MECDSVESLDHAEAFGAIGRAIAEGAPDGWQQLRLHYRATIQIDAARMQAVDAAGLVSHIEVPDAAMDCLTELRSTMYQPGKGTWFTARFVLDLSGKYSVDFDYDNEPDFVPQLTAGAYALDQEYFPRDADHTPNWLSAKLLEAETDR